MYTLQAYFTAVEIRGVMQLEILRDQLYFAINQFYCMSYTLCPILLCLHYYAGIPGTMTLQIALRPATNGPDNIVFANLSHKTIFPKAS